MTEQSSDSLTESLEDQCHVNEEHKLIFYAKSDFSATTSDQVIKSKGATVVI